MDAEAASQQLQTRQNRSDPAAQSYRDSTESASCDVRLQREQSGFFICLRQIKLNCSASRAAKFAFGKLNCSPDGSQLNLRLRRKLKEQIGSADLNNSNCDRRERFGR